MENRNPVIVGLDIGTTKIAVIAGRKNEFGKLEILGFGRANSVGVSHGQVQNIEETIKSINQALQNCYASNPSLQQIKEVYVGIAGHHIRSLQTRGDLVRHNTDEEITYAEIQQLIDNQYKTYIPAGDEIIDVVPQEFTVDNYQNVLNPVGYGGVKVGANFHIITGDRNAIRNINRAVTKSTLNTADLVLQPLASASAVMCDTDFEAGVAIVDIGGGTTDIAIFCDGVLRHTAVIPFGGENITNDIKLGLGVLRSQAEAMKVQFGSALPDETMANAYITIPGLRGMPAKEISVRNLSRIIEARIKEIMDFVCYHIKQIGMDARQLNGGIILTGGGAQLKHLIQLTEYSTGINARIGLPNENLAANHPKELANPMYATCIGLILKGYHVFEKNNQLYQAEIASKEVLIAEEELPDINEEITNTITSEAILNDTEVSSTPEVTKEAPTKVSTATTKKRGLKLNSFMDKFKTGIINIFKEEDDTEL
jgi:cell division protein FtsA